MGLDAHFLEPLWNTLFGLVISSIGILILLDTLALTRLCSSYPDAAVLDYLRTPHLVQGRKRGALAQLKSKYAPRGRPNRLNIMMKPATLEEDDSRSI